MRVICASEVPIASDCSIPLQSSSVNVQIKEASQFALDGWPCLASPDDTRSKRAEPMWLLSGLLLAVLRIFLQSPLGWPFQGGGM